MKKLPVGIQTFKEIRNEDYVYVDKTKLAFDLISQGKYYFLSRPRRFGKSLLVDTLKCVFSGDKDLFKGLYIYDKWDWKQSFPIIKIDLAGGVLKNESQLIEKLSNQLSNHAEQFGLALTTNNISERFEELIRKIHDSTGKKVVILVDEYDKPILDNITDVNISVTMRDGLKNIYSVIKGADEYIRFVFLTGVSKFSKVSLFSGLNNLEDITIDGRYSTVCGYTQSDLEESFSELLTGCDLGEIKTWYNGYSWLGEKVYNPFDILLFFSKGNDFRNYWFESGTPSFLIKLIQEKNYFIPRIENIKAGEDVLGSFNVEDIQIETLLFQAGYVTIDQVVKVGVKNVYLLKYPNLEVKNSLTDYILSSLTSNYSEKQANQTSLFNALKEKSLEKLKHVFHAFFASIPHDWYRKNNLANYEGYYASIFYCYFASLGLDVTPEDTTNHGRIDLALTFEGSVYLFEFKVAESVDGKFLRASSSLEQIKQKKYYEKYLDCPEIFLVGVTFSKADRNISVFEWERVEIAH